MSGLAPGAPAAADLQRLLDQAAIREVLACYFHGADAGDPSIVRSCFTPDVQARYTDRPPVVGLDALMAQIPLFGNLSSGACTICTHFMGNLRFAHLEAAAVDTETHAFAFLVVPEGEGNVVNMRSLRYLDRWRRADAGWKIAVRTLTLDWSCQVPASFARAFPQRLRGLPEVAGS